MRTYTQLTREQRYQLYALLKMGHSQTEIAKVIGFRKTGFVQSLNRSITYGHQCGLDTPLSKLRP